MGCGNLFRICHTAHQACLSCIVLYVVWKPFLHLKSTCWGQILENVSWCTNLYAADMATGLVRSYLSPLVYFTDVYT